MFHEFKVRKVTTGFGKMEAIIDFAKNSLSGAVDWVRARSEGLGGE